MSKTNNRPPAITTVHAAARSRFGKGEPVPQNPTCSASAGNSAMTLRDMALSAAREISAIASASRCTYAAPPATTSPPRTAKSHFFRMIYLSRLKIHLRRFTMVSI